MKGQLPNESTRVRENIIFVAIASRFSDHIPVTVD